VNFFKNYFNLIEKGIKSIDHSLLEHATKKIIEVSLKGNKIIIAGNGGSAAIASHVAVDFTKAAGVRAINFNEADLLTCFSNDFGYEKWVEKALEYYADPNDLVILISSSGNSKNIINGAIKAKELGLQVITLSGFDNNNPLLELGDINLWVNSKEYNIIEMTHNIWLVSIVDYIINEFKNTVV